MVPLQRIFVCRLKRRTWRRGQAEQRCVCMCERETRGRGGSQTKVREGWEECEEEEGGGGAKADSREGKLRRGTVEQSEKRPRRRREQGWKIRGLPFGSPGVGK